MFGYLLIFGFINAMMLAIVTDIHSMTISNRISLALVVLFLIAAPTAGLGLPEVAARISVGLLVLLVTMGFFAMGWMGGGDAKLLSVTALWFGPTVDLLDYLLLSSVLGAILTLAFLGARNLALYRPATGIAFMDRLLSPSVGIPYGVALGSVAIYVFLRSGWPAALV